MTFGTLDLEFCKVGRVSEVGHSRKKSALNQKKSILDFWASCMQNWLKIPNMTLFFEFGAPGSCMKQLELKIFYFFCQWLKFWDIP